MITIEGHRQVGDEESRVEVGPEIPGGVYIEVYDGSYDGGDVVSACVALAYEDIIELISALGEYL